MVRPITRHIYYRRYTIYKKNTYDIAWCVNFFFCVFHRRNNDVIVPREIDPPPVIADVHFCGGWQKKKTPTRRRASASIPTLLPVEAAVGYARLPPTSRAHGRSSLPCERSPPETSKHNPRYRKNKSHTLPCCSIRSQWRLAHFSPRRPNFSPPRGGSVAPLSLPLY